MRLPWFMLASVAGGGVRRLGFRFALRRSKRFARRQSAPEAAARRHPIALSRTIAGIDSKKRDAVESCRGDAAASFHGGLAMAFRIIGLEAEPFRHLFGQPDDALAHLGVQRHVVDAKPGFPDRITLDDIEPGETALLLNFTHQPANSPFRSSHAIFVREGAQDTFDAVDTIPQMMRRRVMSLRAFNEAGCMVDADLAEGHAIERVIDRLLAGPRVAYLHAHFARQGCYAAHVERA